MGFSTRRVICSAMLRKPRGSWGFVFRFNSKRKKIDPIRLRLNFCHPPQSKKKERVPSLLGTNAKGCCTMHTQNSLALALALALYTTTHAHVHTGTHTLFPAHRLLECSVQLIPATRSCCCEAVRFVERRWAATGTAACAPPPRWPSAMPTHRGACDPPCRGSSLVTPAGNRIAPAARIARPRPARRPAGGRWQAGPGATPLRRPRVFYL
jgi:hypothetical protein